MNIADSFKNNGIVPALIAAAPQEVAEVTYPSGASAKLGNELTPTNVKDIPKVTFNAEAGAFYSLFLVHPITSKAKEMFHWAVVNIPGDNVSAGETLFEFIGAGPPQSAGLLNYIFLVFKQNGKIDVSAEPHVKSNSRSHRGDITINGFTSKYNISQLVAGNFFQAQYDDYVNTLYNSFADA